MKNNYDDIIRLPHHVSKNRPQMSITDRAAQFSPFSALVGFENEISETNRLTENFVQFDENYLNELDEKLTQIEQHLSENPVVELIYYVPDSKKSGGKYVTVQGRVKQIDKVKFEICLTDKRKIKISNIVSIETDIS